VSLLLLLWSQALEPAVPRRRKIKKARINRRLNSGPWARMGRLCGPSSQAPRCTITFLKRSRKKTMN
jgi:hypothetical protein